MCSFDSRTYNYLIFFSRCMKIKYVYLTLNLILNSYFIFFNPVTVVFIIVLRHVTKCSEMKFITISVFREIANRRIKNLYFT